jgi:glycosyltransferase involved in cell wall biosynthesis
MKASRIVAVLQELSFTGAPRLSLDILETLGREASVRIVSWEGGPLIDATRRVGPTVVLRRPYLERVIPRRFATGHVAGVLAGGSRRIRSVILGARLRRWKPELVYVSSVGALPLVRMLGLGKVPVVLHVHEMGSALAWAERLSPGLIRSIPDRYVADSEAVAHDLVDQLGVPPDTIRVVTPYLLPPVSEMSPTARPIDRTPVIVGGAGNPSWTKGVDLWLLAAREAVDRLGADRLRFVWVGCRDNEAGLQFRTMISKLGLDGVVELVPTATQIHEHFARFDMFAMTSWEDSFPLVVLEAMALGAPVICFAPTGGPAEEVGDAGVVIQEISPHLMADAIVDLVESPEKRRAMGLASATRVHEKFTRVASLALLAEVFDSAIAAPRRHA